jgi:hypothetical protein
VIAQSRYRGVVVVAGDRLAQPVIEGEDLRLGTDPQAERVELADKGGGGGRELVLALVDGAAAQEQIDGNRRRGLHADQGHGEKQREAGAEMHRRGVSSGARGTSAGSRPTAATP